MDYVKSKYPPQFIGDVLNLTTEQVTAALSYIETNRTEVEAEYQIVLKEAEEIRRYWEECNRERLAEIAKLNSVAKYRVIINTIYFIAFFQFKNIMTKY